MHKIKLGTIFKSTVHHRPNYINVVIKINKGICYAAKPIFSGGNTKYFYEYSIFAQQQIEILGYCRNPKLLKLLYE